ncbi:MAG: hypothetical protein WBB64_09995, partial [Anaerolineales bacterium]
MKKLLRLRNQGGQRDRLSQSIRKLPDLLFKLGRGLKLESGRSLPAALITLAVGSMLLTPFLSFVSTRSLGTRAATETFNEQYAADAGIEFGIWSLLNDPAFRTQVDINAGTAQPLAFPSPINGYTPTISVTGLPIGSWYLRQFFPSIINSGGSLAYAGGDRVYGLGGNSSTTFGYYSIAADQWFSLASTPQTVQRGGSLAYGGGNYLYALRGRNTDNFWRYNITTNNWSNLEDTPSRVRQGGALVYDGGNYLYALRGSSNNYWRYNISTDSWGNRANTPNSVSYGSDLVYTGGNYIYAFRGSNSTNFWRYNISSNSWSSRQNAPATVNNGGSLAYYSGDYIYAMRGNSTGFWRYTVTMDSWTVLTDT